MPKAKVRAEGPLPDRPVWETINDDEPGYRVHCLIDDARVRGKIHTYFGWITDVVAVDYDDDNAPEEFDVYPDLNHGSAAYRLKRRSEYPESYDFIHGQDYEDIEDIPFATLELAKAALESVNIPG
jgi:hypothetical protein